MNNIRFLKLRYLACLIPLCFMRAPNVCQPLTPTQVLSLSMMCPTSLDYLSDSEIPNKIEFLEYSYHTDSLISNFEIIARLFILVKKIEDENIDLTDHIGNRASAIKQIVLEGCEKYKNDPLFKCYCTKEEEQLSNFKWWNWNAKQNRNRKRGQPSRAANLSIAIKDAINQYNLFGALLEVIKIVGAEQNAWHSRLIAGLMEPTKVATLYFKQLNKLNKYASYKMASVDRSQQEHEFPEIGNFVDMMLAPDEYKRKLMDLSPLTIRILYNIGEGVDVEKYQALGLLCPDWNRFTNGGRENLFDQSAQEKLTTYIKDIIDLRIEEEEDEKLDLLIKLFLNARVEYTFTNSDRYWVDYINFLSSTFEIIASHILFSQIINVLKKPSIDPDSELSGNSSVKRFSIASSVQSNPPSRRVSDASQPQNASHSSDKPYLMPDEPEVSGKEVAYHEDSGSSTPPGTAMGANPTTPSPIRSIPDTPTTPAMPSVPTTPAMPSVPTTPVMPSVPTTPVMPSVPTTPAMPSVPTTPAMQSVPTTPVTQSVPTTPPTIPMVPEMTSVPTTPPTIPMSTTPTTPTTPSTAPAKPETVEVRPQVPLTRGAMPGAFDLLPRLLAQSLQEPQQLDLRNNPYEPNNGIEERMKNADNLAKHTHCTALTEDPSRTPVRPSSRSASPTVRRANSPGLNATPPANQPA